MPERRATAVLLSRETVQSWDLQCCGRSTLRVGFVPGRIELRPAKHTTFERGPVLALPSPHCIASIATAARVPPMAACVRCPHCGGSRGFISPRNQTTKPDVAAPDARLHVTGPDESARH